MTPTQRLITTLVILLAIVAGLYYYSTRPHGSIPSPISTSSPSASATATSTPNAGIKLETPDYNKPIVFSADISADIRAQLNAELATVQADLAKNPLSVKDWVNLGTLHKMGGDYSNAALYWEYLASSYSGTGVPYYSLGDLYQNFLHDYTKAEADYKLAIQTDPTNVNAYASLYTLYHYTLHDDTKAAAILTAGLAANPGNNYLLGLQQELQSQ